MNFKLLRIGVQLDDVEIALEESLLEVGFYNALVDYVKRECPRWRNYMVICNMVKFVTTQMASVSLHQFLIFRHIKVNTKEEVTRRLYVFCSAQ